MSFLFQRSFIPLFTGFKLASPVEGNIYHYITASFLVDIGIFSGYVPLSEDFCW